MQFALLIYESAEAFASRKKDEMDAYTGAWRAYYKALLGGFTVLELASLDAALDWAARCPAASFGAVEVRPLAPDMKRRVEE